MKIILLIFAFLAVPIFGLNKNTFENEIKPYINKFLFLKNTKKYCEKNNLLLAPNTDNLFNLVQVLNICNSKEKCDFISFSPKRQLRNSLHYENDEMLKNTGANWFCSGNDWNISKSRKYWITAIKEDNIKNQMKLYNLTLNMTGECDEKDILLKINKPITPKESADECNKISNCKYIILNYEKKIGEEETIQPRAILCSKIPMSKLNKLGYLIAEKYEENIQKFKKEKKREIPLKTSKGGSITADNYYKSFNKGSIVHSEKL